MKQEYERYTTADVEVWKALYTRQVANLQDKAAGEYLACLKNLNEVFNDREVPRFDRLEELINEHQGWSIEVVKGLIPVRDFWALLAQRTFCSSTWLRTMEQLDYLEEPDMFHDSFGHMPLLIDPAYSSFAQRLGQLGLKCADDEEKTIQLQRLYWFTIEFGLLGTPDDVKIYGAGILSSFGETNHIYSDKVEIIPFDLHEVLYTPFINSEIQTKYYLIEKMSDLDGILDQVTELME